ncbi:MAG: DNA topoisomerase III [Ruminococcaceae bacterium]|nr:DNA topoisomerase III [Oscillospiraceae bacterium]
MKLIIAEKPSLARSIAAALGDPVKGSGFLTVGDTIVTWAFGHLFSLADIEDYTGGVPNQKWTLAGLPCFPGEFRYKLRGNDPGVKHQFDVIRSLCRRPDVDTIINAGDSDREGEIIVRLCIMMSFDLTPSQPFFVEGKRLCRLWLPDQTAETIVAAATNPGDEREYDKLANEGFARTYMDWLYGINLTRYATLKSGALLRVGRVIVPIVRAICERDRAIRNFVPEKYYQPRSAEETNGAEVELTSKLKFDKDSLAKCQAKCAEYNNFGATVLSVKRKKDKLSPGKLWSLSKLQSFLGKKFKMSMNQSLEILQKLYEEGYVTYPRTNSEYLATAEKDKMRRVIDRVKNLGYPVVFKESKQIFDDSKIEAHSALTPTTKIPDKTKLTPDESKVYGAIMRRFAAVFCGLDCIVDRTEIKIAVGNPPENGEEFTLKGMVMVEPGWTKFDDYSTKDKVLPPLKKGDAVNINFAPAEKETSPPKHYTIETLNNYLKNPFREDLAKSDEEDDAEEYRAVFEGLELGTEATRTQIIDNARKSEYIQLKKDVYTILPAGEYLVDALGGMGIGMDKYKTAELGRALKRVYRGELSVRGAAELAEAEISEVFARANAPDSDGFAGDLVGKCPLCGGDVVRTRRGYGCKNYRDGCKFTIWATISGRRIAITEARALLTDGETEKLDGFVSKKGNPYSAKLKLDGEKVALVFDNAPPPPPPKIPTGQLIPGLPVDESFMGY